MRRTAITLIALIVALILSLPVLGAEKVTQSMTCDTTNTTCVHTFNITFASDGSVTDTAIESQYFPYLKNKFVYSMLTIPGTLTASYDITLVDENGWDVCQGQAANRSATDDETVLCAASSKPYTVVNGGSLTLNVDNNSEESTLKIITTYSK